MIKFKQTYTRPKPTIIVGEVASIYNVMKDKKTFSYIKLMCNREDGGIGWVSFPKESMDVEPRKAYKFSGYLVEKVENKDGEERRNLKFYSAKLICEVPIETEGIKNASVEEVNKMANFNVEDDFK